MTGYGRGTADRDGWRVVAEIRSVNHRYTDLKLRGGSLDPAVEEKVAAAVRARVERGSISVTIRVDGGATNSGVKVDLGAARRALHELQTLSVDLQLDQPVSLELLCAQPGVLKTMDAPTDAEAMGACVLSAVSAAMDAMISMRETEGDILSRDLSARLEHLVEIVNRLDQLVEAAPGEAQKRLEERLQRLLSKSKVEVDPDRLAQEVALAADRQDVTEELVRLRSHIEQAGMVIASSGGTIGRRLGFLVQEFGREFNTVSSKSQSAEIANAVVEAKAELEKMREQVQNIE